MYDRWIRQTRADHRRSSPRYSLLSVGLAGVGISFGPAVMQWILTELPDDEQNTGFGLVWTIYMMMSSLGPAMLGLIPDAFNRATSFGFRAILLVSVVVVLLYW